MTIRKQHDSSWDGSGPSTVAASAQSVSGVAFSLHHVPARDALIVQAQPPRAPATDIHHVPGDIVLVIDVSASMNLAVNVPGESETTGLSVLDLVRHAALAIVETLDESDRLGLVTFSTVAEVVQPLRSMTEENKKEMRTAIRGMRVQRATNLWGGITEGLKLFSSVTPKQSNVPALMVLTDGLPNHMCPAQGYVRKLRSMMPLPAPIHTFGFGYQLCSGLLKSIAEVSGGNYSFIPDAGMVGTVFVHAAANLQSTFATDAVLQLSCAPPSAVSYAIGSALDLGVREEREVRGGAEGENARMQLTIHLGALQYGQSRDVFVTVGGLSDAEWMDAVPGIEATLTFREVPIAEPSSEELPSQPTSLSLSFGQGALRTGLDGSEPVQAGSLSEAEVAYHESRTQVCSYIASLFPCRSDGEHRHVTLDGQAIARFDSLVRDLPANSFSDAQNRSLVQDLVGAEPGGQISLAVKRDNFFKRWGKDYLPSYLNAHMRQVCNSFKDAGPQRYGVDSPLFVSCRDRLDRAFDQLPPPQPSVPQEMVCRALGRGHSPGLSVSHRTVPGASRKEADMAARFVRRMSTFNSRDAPCFATSAEVELADGKMLAVGDLTRGMEVMTPTGPSRVAMVLETRVEDEPLCRLGRLLVTPWHPISRDGTTWHFPVDLADGTDRYTGFVRSILLEPNHRSGSHAVLVGGVWGVTLGHGVCEAGDDDVRAHAYLGNYRLVEESLSEMGMTSRGIVAGAGVIRDPTTGRVCGFKRAAEELGPAGGGGSMSGSLQVEMPARVLAR